MTQQIVFNIDELDDPVLPDGIPSFEGGQFSNWRANLLKADQSKFLTNTDIDKLGRARTRRGATQIGAATPDASANAIQGLTSFLTKDYNYVVAAQNKKIYAFNGATWAQIATGGCVDNDPILIGRLGAINNATGYSIGDTVLTVDGFVGVVGNGDALYFVNNLKNDPWKYIIASHAETAGNTTTITLENPGLVFDIRDNWSIIVMRPAAVNNGAGYAAGTTTITIDGYVGVVNNNEYFVIVSENKQHKITGHAETGGNTTSLTFTPGLQASYLAADATVPIVFAEGNNQLFFCDGIGSIFGWNGATTLDLSALSILDYLTGSAYHQAQTNPPTGVSILLWYQNRLIASGIAAEPDAIYFSDFQDPTGWDKDYQMLRVGAGDSDPITGLVPWTDLNMLVFKKSSIHVINLDPSQNPDPTDPTALVSSFSVKVLHHKIGCPAPFSAVQVGGGSSSPGSDVFFLDDNKKVRSIRRVFAAEQQQEVGDAVSLPIQDVLDRINLTYINRCVGWYHNDHYLLALPVDGATRPNVVVAYNLLTQSWCGGWTGWLPDYFSNRLDQGSIPKMIFGQSDGKVATWLDDLSTSEEVQSTYEDFGNVIPTGILTRAITFGDPFNFKTGLGAEFEFDESAAGSITIQAVLDGAVNSNPIAMDFSTLSSSPVVLPLLLPFLLSDSPGLLRRSFDLQRYGTWRELQFYITSTSKKLSIRSIRVFGFMDTLRIQTIPGPQQPGFSTPQVPPGT